MFDLLISVRLEGVRGDARPELAALLSGLAAAVFTLTPGQIGRGRGKAKVVNPAKLSEWVAEAAPGIFELVPDSDPNASLQLAITPKGAELNLAFGAGSPAIVEPAVFDSAARVLTDFAGTVQTYSALSVRGMDYRAARPPRDPLVGDQSSLVEVVDRRALRSPEEKAAGGRLLTADLPAGAGRSSAGSAVAINWAAGLTVAQPAEIAEALSRRSRWLASNAVGTIAPNWNAEGDVLSDPVGAAPHPGLTLYSPVLQTGYVAVHSTMPGPARERALKSAAALRKAGSAGPDSPLTDLFVIAESREAAFRLRPEIEAAGLKRVLYATDDHFWDPFPEGNWL
jgi:hypothetical protein